VSSQPRSRPCLLLISCTGRALHSTFTISTSSPALMQLWQVCCHGRAWQVTVVNTAPSNGLLPGLSQHRAIYVCCCLLCCQISSTVEFSRIWWDKHSKHPSMTQVSLWRPVPPPGYVTLGDCMVTGMYCPPNSALVLRDTDPSEHVDGQPPLLARPMSCLAVGLEAPALPVTPTCRRCCG